MKRLWVLIGFMLLRCKLKMAARKKKEMIPLFLVLLYLETAGVLCLLQQNNEKCQKTAY